jgi:hypothetical protein
MKNRKGNFFLYSGGVLLLITGLAKVISGVGSARILAEDDPITAIPFRYLFLGCGALELVIAMICFFGKRSELGTGLVAWLATDFVLYRVGLLWIGYHKPCSCLGNLTDALHIPPDTADAVMKGVLGYLLVGSYATLIWLARQRQKATMSPAGFGVGPSTA